VRGVIGAEQVTDRDVSIALGRRKRSVSKELLNGAKIRAAVEHVGGARVA
jgi:hypothetical protein